MLLQFHLLLLLDLQLLVDVVVALVNLMKLAHVVVVGQGSEGIVVDAAAAMVAMSFVVMRHKVRELICRAREKANGRKQSKGHGVSNQTN